MTEKDFTAKWIEDMLAPSDMELCKQDLASLLQSEAVRFAEWIDKMGFILKANHTVWIQIMDTLAEQPFTSEQLYQQFKEEE
jgi:hypothetical protein